MAESPDGKAEKRCGTSESIVEEEKVTVLGFM